MIITKKRQELPVFGDMIANLFEDNFFETKTKSNIRKTPLVNIFENKNEFSLQLATPGLKKENFEIDLKNNLLTISASTKVKNDSDLVLEEFSYNNFKRVFKLPKNADPSKIDATYQDGVLGIVIHKKEKEIEKSVKVNIA